MPTTLIPPNELSGNSLLVEREELDTTLETIDPDYGLLFDFKKAEVEIRQLVNSWSEEIQDTESRRSIRNIEIDVDDLRSSGKISQDETFIPVRVVDSNIRREQPPYLEFLTQSRRFLIFKDPLDPSFVTTPLEESFRDGLSYEGWESDFFKCIDGAQTHGWDFLEVIYDKSMPFHVRFEHIGHDKLIFPLDAIKIENCQRILRRHDLSLLQLKRFVSKYGFNADEVNKILDARRNRNDVSTVAVYKQFFKYNDVVYVSWICLEDSVSDWIKKPQKLFLGIMHQEEETYEEPLTDPLTGVSSMVSKRRVVWRDSDINQYPIAINPYSETEKDKVFNYKGRVFLDEYRQEAQTACTTAFVNGLLKASETYAAVDADDPGGNIKALQDLSPGEILNRPVNFFHQDWPDPSVINALRYLDTQGSEEAGQIAFAVSNRKDSRKTATEIQEARRQNQQLNSIQILLFSTFCRRAFTFAWKIVQSLALRNEIIVVPLKVDGQILPFNDTNYISRNYLTKAAGDIDVVERAEKLNRMLQLWALVANTALAVPFLINILKIAFPDDAAFYESLLKQDSITKQMLSSLYQLIKTIRTDIDNIIPGEQQQNFDSLMEAVAQVVGDPNPNLREERVNKE